MYIQRRLCQAMILGAVLCLLTVPIHAQGPNSPDNPQPLRAAVALHFSHLTSDDGLAQNTIEAIVQDNQGFMWFATASGLSRFDGYRFTTFEHNTKNPKSLAINTLRTLFKDRDGHLWIGTEGAGVDKFDPQTETFTHFQPSANRTNSIGGDRIVGIYQDIGGNLWFGGGGINDLSRLNVADQTFTRFRRGTDQTDPKTYQGDAARSFIETGPDQLWFTADSSLVNYDQRADRFTSFAFPIRTERNANVVKQDLLGMLWIGGSEALYRFDLQSRNFSAFPAVRGVNDLWVDVSGLLWIGTTDGLVRFDPRSAQVIDQYRHVAGQADSLSSSDITAIYQDQAGVLWLGTRNAGLNILDPRQARFAHFRNNATTPSSVPQGAVSALSARGKDQVWVGIGNSLSLLNVATGQTTNYRVEPDLAQGATIRAILEDQSGSVWLGMSPALLIRFDPKTSTFERFSFNGVGLPDIQAPRQPDNRSGPPLVGSVTALYEDAQRTLWVVNDQRGIYQLDAARKATSFIEGPHVPSPQGNANQTSTPTLPILPILPITYMTSDGQGGFWLATLNGLLRFDGKTANYERYRLRTNPVGPDSRIEMLQLDAQKRLWIAAEDGLYRLDPTTRDVQQFTTEDGLPSNALYSIVQDQSGFLWVGTNRGLGRVDPTLRTPTFRVYDAADGLQSNEFSVRASTVTQDGQVVFGGVDGVTVFRPDQLQDNPYQSPVVLTGLQIGNRPVAVGDGPLPKPLWDMTTLALNYDQNVVAFEFSALSYAAPQKNRYQYKLEGFDRDWNSSTRRFAAYTNLPAGEYTFRVRATNNDGVWSNREVSLRLVIAPPWWETPIFRVLAGVALVGLVLGGVQWRVFSIRRRNRLLEHEVAERTQALRQRTHELQASEDSLRHAKEAAEAANHAKSAFLANMSHELRSPLNAILGFAQVLNRNSSLPTDAHQNLDIILKSGEHLLGLINQVLDLSKIEAGRMTTEAVDFDLHQLLADVETLFSLKAAQKSLQLIFDYSETLPHYIRTDEVKLRQVLINLISNALKFTSEGGVTVRARRSENNKAPKTAGLEIIFEVEDTGPGIAPNELRDLFRAFSQTTAGKHAQEGTGLGLPISRKFVQLMGGDITVKSQVGKGSTFRFTIQCQSANAAQPHEPTIERRVVAIEPDQPRYRLLIADDKWVNRQLLIQLLGPLGFDLREAQDGQEAVDIAQVFEPHLIWMDLRMANMDGLEATRLIKATPKGQPMIIIALTASAFEEDREAVLAAGCSNFVRKPFRAEAIFDLLKHYLGVRFTYSDDQPPSAGARLDVEDLQAALGTLPAATVNNLREGIELGDLAMINQTLVEIRQQHPGLAEALHQLSREFKYDQLLTLMGKVTLR